MGGSSYFTPPTGRVVTADQSVHSIRLFSKVMPEPAELMSGCASAPKNEQLYKVRFAASAVFLRASVVGWEKRASPSTRLDAEGWMKRRESNLQDESEGAGVRRAEVRRKRRSSSRKWSVVAASLNART